MPAPLNFDKLLIGDTCQISPDLWNSLVKYVRCSIVAGATVNSTEVEIINTCMGQLLNVDIPVGGGTPELCQALKVNLGTTGAGDPIACINYGIITIPPAIQDRDYSQVPPALWPRAAAGATPVYEQNLIELTVEGLTYNPNDPNSWCVPYDPDTDIILLRVEARGGDEGLDPENQPELVVVPNEIMSLDIRVYPRTPSADFDDILSVAAEYELNNANPPVNEKTKDEVNGVFHWPLYDPYVIGGNVMGCNMQIQPCGANKWQLSGLPSGYGIAPEAVYVPPDDTPPPTPPP